MLARNRRQLAQARSARTAGRGQAWARTLRAVGELAPKGLYARALIIIIAPIVLLESVVAFAFMERHWNQVTRRLSEAMARDIAAIVDIYEASTGKDDITQLIDIGAEPVRTCRWRCCRRATCRRRSPSRSSICSTARCRTRSARRSSGRSGSTPSASRGTWRSASSSTRRSCASSPRAGRPTPPTRTSS